MTHSEDRRSAIGIKMDLASNLITVALAFIGAEGGIAVFVFDKRQHLSFFYLVGGAAFLALTVSVIFGGLGISKTYRAGYEGNWILPDKGRFHSQALFCLLGAGLVLVSSILGEPKVDTAQIELDSSLKAKITLLEMRVEELTKRQGLLDQDLSDLRASRSQSSAVHSNTARK
jgi:hypothetical protein